MQHDDDINYRRVAKAIDYINAHYQEQPGLDDLAGYLGLSPHHFQRIFVDWAGVSPKKFLQYVSLSHAKDLLRKRKLPLSLATYQVGLSSPSRLHDLFISIEGMTPGEYKNGGSNLTINYSHQNTPFGKILVASTDRGICHMTFQEDNEGLNESLKSRFPNASLKNLELQEHEDIVQIFSKNWNNQNEIKLHLKGTDFQLSVWQALLKIPYGSLLTYGDIAKHIDKPKASRAVGTAIGSNPIAFVIPCHRVIQSSGVLGGYRWGTTRKQALIGWEQSNLPL